MQMVLIRADEQVESGFEEYVYPANDYDNIYRRIFKITHDRDIAEDAEFSCKYLLGIGSSYTFDGGSIELIDD